MVSYRSAILGVAVLAASVLFIGCFPAIAQIKPQQGGTGASNTGGADMVVVGDGDSFEETTLPDCDDSVGQHLNYDQTADTFSCGTTSSASHGDGANCSASQYPLGVDASGAVQSCTADDDTPDDDSEVPDAITVAGGSVATSDITFKGSATPTPTVNGRCEWDTDGDGIHSRVLVCGDGATQSKFYPLGDVRKVGDCVEGACFANGEDNGRILICEGATNDTYENTFGFKSACDPAADHAIELQCDESGDVLTTGSTDDITEDLLKAVDAPGDEECLTYEATVGDFEWQTCGGSGHGDGANCGAGNYPLGVDASGAVQSCTADDDQPDTDGEVPNAITVSGGQISSSDITFRNTGGPTPTISGQCEWNSTSDRLVCGDGASQVVFYTGSHTTDTGPSPDCAGTDQYQDGEGDCDTVGGDLSGGLDVLAIGTDKVDADNLKDTDSPGDEECLTYEATGTTFEWQTCGGAGHGDGANCSANQYPLGVDASGAVQSCTADDDTPDDDSEVPDAITVAGGTVNTSDFTFKGSATPTPTGNGTCEWDNDGDGVHDRVLVCGDGATQQRFYPLGDIRTVGNCTSGACFANGNNNGRELVYEGATDDTYENTLGFKSSCDPSADHDIELPCDETGDVLTTGSTDGIIEGLLKAVDAPGDEECLTYEATVGDFEWQTCGTGHGDGADCGAGNYPLGVDASGAVQSCTADDDTPDDDSEVPNAISVISGWVSSSDFTFKGGASPTPTATGRCEWDTDDFRIVCGDGTGQKTFYNGAHTTDTGPSPDCSGTSTYQDGEGGCDAVGGDLSGGLDALVIGADKVLESHLKAVDAASDEECLTYEVTTGDFEWQTCGGVDTGPSPDCSGTSTYQDGEGGCDTVGGDLTGGLDALAIGTDKVDADNLKDTDAPGDEECLTYESTGTTFEWQACGGSDTNAKTLCADGEVLLGETSTTCKEVLTYDHLCKTIERLEDSESNLPLWVAPAAVTVKNVWCRCQGTCSAMASVRLEDGAGNAMTGTHACVNATGALSKTAISAGGALVSLEMMRFDETDGTIDDGDTYTICWDYDVD